jgi:hypothetical protein
MRPHNFRGSGRINLSALQFAVGQLTNSKPSVGLASLSAPGSFPSNPCPRDLVKLAVSQLCDRRATVIDALNSPPV